VVDVVGRVAGTDGVRVDRQQLLVHLGLQLNPDFLRLHERRLHLDGISLQLGLALVLLALFEAVDDCGEFGEGVQLEAETLDGLDVGLELFRVVVFVDYFVKQIVLLGLHIILHPYYINISAELNTCPASQEESAKARRVSKKQESQQAARKSTSSKRVNKQQEKCRESRNSQESFTAKPRREGAKGRQKRTGTGQWAMMIDPSAFYHGQVDSRMSK